MTNDSRLAKGRDTGEPGATEVKADGMDISPNSATGYRGGIHSTRKLNRRPRLP